MITKFRNLEELFHLTVCVFCKKQLIINTNAVTGFFEKEGCNLLAIDEINGNILFSVNTHNNKTIFSNKDVEERLEVFVLEFRCKKDEYRKTFSLYFDQSKNMINKILLDEEDVLIIGKESTYWVRNMFFENVEPSGKISVWDNKEDDAPPTQFDLDIMEDLFATLQLETECLKISPTMESLQEKIENLITFG